MTNSNVKTETKKVTILTPTQRKAQMKAKRQANPQVSHLASTEKKRQEANEKKDVYKSIQAGRKWIKEAQKVKDFSTFENTAQLNEAVKFANYIMSKKGLEENFNDFTTIVKRDKKTGNIGFYKGAQAIQRIAKLMERFDTYEGALGYAIAQDKKRAEKA